MPLDLYRIFPMNDAPSARLMKLKALCLSRAGVLTDAEKAAIQVKAEAYMNNPRFGAALPPRKVA